MIYTVTLNPSLDYTAKALSEKIGATNRTQDEYIVPGGKGLNVSIILSRLGLKSTAFGFTAGFSGEELKRLLAKHDIICDFTDIYEGFTRINVKLVTDTVTEYNGSGVKINDSDFSKLCEKIKNISPKDTLILSGSIPKGVRRDAYSVLAKCAPRETRVIIDAASDALTSALSVNPFLIKPNADELAEIFGCEITDTDTVFKYAAELRKKGAKNVLVSLGKDGAVLLSENGNKYRAEVPFGTAVNTVGAGDSMLAAFCAAYISGKDYGECLRLAVAAGSATAYSVWLAEKSDILNLCKAIAVTQL